MFVYLRYFYAISLVLVIAGSILVGEMIRSMNAEGIAKLVREHDQAIAARYISSIWGPHYPLYVPPGPEQRAKLQKFYLESQKFINDLPKLRLQISAASGKSILRTTEATIQNEEEEDISRYRFKEEISTDVLSRILEDVQYRLDGTTKEVTVIQSLIPVLNNRYQPDSKLCQSLGANARAIPLECQETLAVIEIVSDISEQWDDLNYIQLLATFSIIGIFVALISILFFTTQRAEAIIAKQHEANMELISAAATAEAENRDKSQFLANISHELRTPLNAIIGFSEILKNEALSNLNNTHQEYVLDIHNSGKHLLSLINDILDYSKAEAGKLEISLAEVDLTKLLIHSMRLVIPRAEQAQVTLAEDLPKEHIVCETDGKKLKQVILNLLSNAVKFTPAGGEVRIQAWQKVADGTVNIVVKDTGIGIAPKDLAKVMSPFGQVDIKLSRKYEGTGLGLPLARKFVEALGGEFLIESEVNVGTTITIVLPGPSQ